MEIKENWVGKRKGKGREKYTRLNKKVKRRKSRITIEWKDNWKEKNIKKTEWNDKKKKIGTKWKEGITETEKSWGKEGGRK